MMKKTKLLVTFMTVILMISMLSLLVSAAELSGSAITVVGFSSHQDDPEDIDDDYEAAFAVDGDADTFWSNQYNPEAGGEPPHFIVLDLGSSVTVSGFKYLPRQDGYNGVENGDLGDYEIYIGDNKDALTTLSYSGSFTTFTGAQSTATFTTPATGRYLKLVSPTQRWIGIAELVIITQAAVQSEAQSEAPQTGDNGIALLSIVAIAALFALIKFRKAVRN
ncbi:MAG: discoidin domain-containing protein [Saccharofermentanales bacterium]